MRKINYLAMFLVVGTAVACGGEERSPGTTPSNNNSSNNNSSNNNNSQSRGFTSCGASTCQPGQYCRDDILADCRNGCLSDLNCTDNQFCDKGTTNDGVCQNKAPNNTNNNNTNTDQIQRCRTACEDAQACGLFDVPTTVECTTGCGGLSDPQAKALADCVDNESCGLGLPGCYNLECGPSYACNAGEDCIGGICL